MQKLNVAEEVLAQKRAEQSEIGAVVLLAEMKCGELLNQMPKATTNHKRQDLEIRPNSKFLNDDSELKTPKAKLEVAKELGFSKD